MDGIMAAVDTEELTIAALRICEEFGWRKTKMRKRRTVSLSR